jgi:hypothetical protein
MRAARRDARAARLFLSTRRISADLPPRLSFGYKSSHAEETDHRRLCISGDEAGCTLLRRPTVRSSPSPPRAKRRRDS